MSKIKKKFLDFEVYEQSEITTISGDLQTNIDGKLGINDKAADSDKLDNQSISYFLNVLSSFSGDVSGTYDAMVVANDSHTHDTRYYTETEVDALTWTESDITDLDKYTQVEVDTISGALQLEIETKSDTSHTHDDRYYTESELDAGQLDNRYFTESEITTWRNGTTQTEMGYVAGVTSDIQTQLNGKLSTTGKAADADKLDNHDSAYFLNTSTTFGGDVSGAYNAIVVANDSHTHDTRYYTETEIDTWRNSTTQTEMGYVAGVTSDIQTQLNGKLSTTGKAADADKLDNHDSAYFLNTSTSFAGDVSGTYDAMVVADDSHNHVISNVDGLQTALDGKSATSHTHDGRYFTETEITTWRNGTTQTEMGYVAGVTSDIQTQLNGKAPSSKGVTNGDSHDHSGGDGAQIDHGSLSGRGDDDHTQYIKADGNRAFTGAVAGVTPTLDAHLTTKGYVDGAVLGLDWQDSVKDKDLTAPPGSPVTGDRYIIAAVATGAWVGHDGDVAEYNGSGWDFTVKSEGLAAWVEDEDVLYTYNGSSWVKFGSTITHNNTSGLQGGTTSQYYHLTSAQHTDLTDGGNSSSHKHDDRYFTETEITTWRNGTTQTEMGYVAGVTSDIQTQLGSKLNADGTTPITGNWDVDGANTLFVDKTNGRVGIGTAIPVTTLDVDGQCYFQSVKIKSNTFTTTTDYELTDNAVIRSSLGLHVAGDGIHFGTQTAGTSAGGWNTDVSERLTILNDGNVGIGITDPQRKLTIQSDSSGSTTTEAHYNADTTNGNGAVISFRTDTTGVGASSFVELSGMKASFKEHDHATRSSTYEFFNTVLGTEATRLILDENGKVSLQNGTAVNEFSIDGTLAGNSDDAVPTEKAVKTYSDTKLNNSGAVTHTGEIKITGTTKAAGYFYAGTTDPTNTNRLNYDGYLYATKIYNAVYNDIADFQKVIDKIEYGKCYYDTSDGAKICTERCQMAVIGIASDTFGFGVGNNADESYAPFAVAGWVLAHVDKEYPTGTPLTNNEDGILTEILPAEKREFPERIVALYKKKEANELWGPNNEIKVNGRHWVKVK